MAKRTTQAMDDPVVTQSMLEAAFEKSNKLITRQIVDEIGGVISEFAARVDERFNKIELRLDVIEAEIRSLNERIDRLEDKYDYIIRTLDAFLKRLTDVETNDAARDAQLARFDRWLHQIADQVNVKLEA